MVLDQVKTLSVYDPDPHRIGEISQKIFEPSKFGACVHDILEEPLPRVHDAIYDFDTLEYISPDDETRYLGNLSRSLSRHHDILIIGLKPCDADDDIAMPGDPLSLLVDFDANADRLQPIKYSAASPFGPDGRTRYRRTSAGVKVLLESHFRAVSLFSMTGGAVQAGTSGAPDYLFAVCSSKKS
jgi:hypothetical protein